MKIHLITIGQPKLAYAIEGWKEYTKRLKRYHTLRITHLQDKNNNASSILDAAKNTKIVALVVGAPELSSHELAQFIEDQSLVAKEISFIIGGPEGLPEQVIQSAETELGLSKLTFPHDLAMLVLAEALYRASTINTGHPYHKG